MSGDRLSPPPPVVSRPTTPQDRAVVTDRKQRNARGLSYVEWCTAAHVRPAIAYGEATEEMWRARWTAGEDPTAYVTPDSMTEIDRALGRVAAGIVWASVPAVLVPEARRAAFKQAKEAIERSAQQSQEGPQAEAEKSGGPISSTPATPGRNRWKREPGSSCPACDGSGTLFDPIDFRVERCDECERYASQEDAFDAVEEHFTRYCRAPFEGAILAVHCTLPPGPHPDGLHACLHPDGTAIVRWPAPADGPPMNTWDGEIAPEHLSPEAHRKAKALVDLIQSGKSDDARVLFERYVADRDHSLCRDEGPCSYEVFVALCRVEAACLGVALPRPERKETP